MTHIKKYKNTYIIVGSLLGLCIGMGAVAPIYYTIPFVFGGWGIGYIIFNTVLSKKQTEEQKYDSVVQEFEGVLSNQESIIKEQEEVITEYEQIFDALSVQLPCVCGGNTFEGLFSPNTNNEVVCEKCQSRYRVDITYDTVLISEPTDNDQPFNVLVGTPKE